MTALLNIPDYNNLLGHPVVEGSWEGFVIKPDKRFVVYSGRDSFSMGEDITAISLPNLMQELLKQ
jgi:hypothetical protein